MPQISVIVPVYNVEKFLRRCVDSILSQSFTDFELILVDDGSKDLSSSICDEFALKDCRVKVIHNSNRGAAVARNTGIEWAFKCSDSEWLYFVDSDDWLNKKTFEVLISAAIRTNKSLIVHNYRDSYGEKLECIEDMTENILNTEEFFCKHDILPILIWGKLYKKELFRNLRYPVGKAQEDEFITYKILLSQKEIVFIDYPLYAYFQNESGLMGTRRGAYYKDGLEAFKERLTWFKEKGIGLGAYRKAERSVFTTYCCYINDLRTKNIIAKRIQMKMELIIFLILSKDRYCVNDYSWFYELAFPKIMSIYWIVKAKLC